MTIRSKLLLNALIPVAVLAALLAVIMATQRRMARLGAEADVADRIVRGVSALDLLTHNYAEYHTDRARSQWLARYASLHELLAGAEFGTAERQAVAKGLARRLDEMASTFRLLVETKETRLDSAEAEDIAVRFQTRLVGRFLATSSWMLTNGFRLAEDSRRQAIRARQRAAAIVLGGLLALAAAIAANSAVIGLSIAKPLRKLREATSVVAEGNLGHRVDLPGNDEFGDLAEAFNRMTLRIERSRAGLAREAVQRRSAEEEARKNEELLRAVFESTSDCILVWDRECNYLFANQAAIDHVGTTRDKVVGKNIRDGLGHIPDFMRLWMSRVDEVFETEKPLRVGDSVRVGDRVVHSESVLSPVRDGGGRMFAVGVVYRDVTERKEAEEELKRYRLHLEELVEQRTADLKQANESLAAEIEEHKRAQRRLQAATKDLERSNRDLEQFAYVASHDLQEPLRMVSSYVQLLAKRYQGRLDADADEFIEFAVDGARRMRQLINDLLAYSRVGTRGKPLERAELDAALDEALLNVQVAIQESGAAVTRDPLPAVRGDASQLVQLFQNLVANAVKFRGEEPPRIHVSAAEEDGEWVVSVRDNGIGIEPRDAERVFDIFQRLHGRDEYPGTGVGLAVCKRIVERHGGRIWVDSAPGKGSTFCFSLPKQGEPTP